MCLDTVTKRFDPPGKHQRVAWKVFTTRKDQLLPAHRDIFGAAVRVGDIPPAIERGKWLRSTDIDMGSNYYPHQIYRSGFHAYLSLEAAERAAALLEPNLSDRKMKVVVVIKVRVSHITVIGTQSGLKVIVAQRMRVPPQLSRYHLRSVWTVRGSRTNYSVQLLPTRCTCPDFVHRKQEAGLACKHIVAALSKFCKTFEIPFPRDLEHSRRYMIKKHGRLPKVLGELPRAL